MRWPGSGPVTAASVHNVPSHAARSVRITTRRCCPSALIIIIIITRFSCQMQGASADKLQVKAAPCSVFVPPPASWGPSSALSHHIPW